VRRLRSDKGKLWSGRQAGGTAEAIGDTNISARVQRGILRQVDNEITCEPQRIAGSVSKIQGKHNEKK
jgi:hypothetical protein